MKRKSVPVTAVWIRKMMDKVQVLIETDGEWRMISEQHVDGVFSHTSEVGALEAAPIWKPGA